ncbi:hypothetical protein KJZ61_03775 [Candidatus Dependentiae bacterium]|nr:hypothetical protein [Candidatus Dependentiae bacterium]
MRYEKDHQEHNQELMKNRGKTRMRQAWQSLYDSTKRKMSRGAQFIARMIPWARNENWRGAAGHSADKKKK